MNVLRFLKIYMRRSSFIMEAIEIRNLKKIYKDFTLNIDRLDIKFGFVTGFIVPNG